MSQPINPLDTITSVLVIDVLQHALLLEDDLLNALIEPELGIYTPGSIKPYIAISVNNPIFFESDREKVLSKANLDKLAIKSPNDILIRKEGVIDITGEVILSKRFIRSKHKYLTPEPTIPVRAVEMAVAVAMNYISYITRHTGLLHSKTPLYSLVKPEYHNLVEDDSYTIVFETMLDDITDFIAADTWHIYFEKLQGTCLIIEKSCDFRIMEYYRLKDELDNIKSDKDNNN